MDAITGAVRRARYAYYEQADRRYLELETHTHHEIVGFTGNVSLKDDRPFLHAEHLGLDHPVTGEALAFTSPLPADLVAVLASLR